MNVEKAYSSLLKMKKDDRGVVAIIVALSLAILIAFMGLAVDVGNAFLVRTQMQAAADSAALAGANSLANGGNKDTAIAISSDLVTQNGFRGGVESNVVVVSIPPGSGPPSPFPSTPSPTYLENNDYVRVVISKDVPLYFAPIIGFANTWKITANAVAGIKNIADCFIARSSFKNTGKASGGGNCSILFGSGGFKGQGSGRINLTGGGDFNAYNGGTFFRDECPICYKNDSLVNAPSNQAGSMPTPPSVPLPTGLTMQTSCAGGICNPGIYNSILDVKSGTYTFNAGTYVLNAGIDMNSRTNISGSGVLLYLNNGGTTESFDGNLKLTAPSSTNCSVGSGVVIYSPNGNITLKGTANLNLEGIVVLPDSQFRSNGSSQFTLAGSLFANDLILDGNTNVTVSQNLCNNFVSASRISLFE